MIPWEGEREGRHDSKTHQRSGLHRNQFPPPLIGTYKRPLSRTYPTGTAAVQEAGEKRFCLPARKRLALDVGRFQQGLPRSGRSDGAKETGPGVLQAFGGEGSRKEGLRHTGMGRGIHWMLESLQK